MVFDMFLAVLPNHLNEKKTPEFTDYLVYTHEADTNKDILSLIKDILDNFDAIPICFLEIPGVNGNTEYGVHKPSIFSDTQKEENYSIRPISIEKFKEKANELAIKEFHWKELEKVKSKLNERKNYAYTDTNVTGTSIPLVEFDEWVSTLQDG